MSDKYYQVDSKSKYRLKLRYKSQSEAIVHVGVACYDYNKSVISPVQVCRYENSAVTVESLSEGRCVIVQADRANLVNWKGDNSLGY